MKSQRRRAGVKRTKLQTRKRAEGATEKRKRVEMRAKRAQSWSRSMRRTGLEAKGRIER